MNRMNGPSTAGTRKSGCCREVVVRGRQTVKVNLSMTIKLGCVMLAACLVMAA